MGCGVTKSDQFHKHSKKGKHAGGRHIKEKLSCHPYQHYVRHCINMSLFFSALPLQLLRVSHCRLVVFDMIWCDSWPDMYFLFLSTEV